MLPLFHCKNSQDFLNLCCAIHSIQNCQFGEGGTSVGRPPLVEVVQWNWWEIGDGDSDGEGGELFSRVTRGW